VGRGILLLSWLTSATIAKFSPGFIQKLIPNSLHTPEVQEWSEVEEGLLRRADLKPEDVPVSERLIVMSEIRARVRRLRARTTGILATIGLALVAAAIIVIFAGRLTSIDATAVSNIDKLKAEIADGQRQLVRLYQLQSLVPQLDETKKRGVKEEIDRVERQILNLREFSLPTDASAVAAMIVQQSKRLEKMNELLDTAWTKSWRRNVAIMIGNILLLLQ
jgi:hypothetical protein